DDLLALVLVRRRAKSVAQLLDLGIARPAEQALIAGRPDPGVQHRIGRADTARGGDEDVPAALGRQVLAGAAGHYAAPLHRLDVDIDAGLAHRLDQHLRRRCHGVVVGRGQHGDRLALVAGLLEELYRLLRVVLL